MGCFVVEATGNGKQFSQNGIFKASKYKLEPYFLLIIMSDRPRSALNGCHQRVFITLVIKNGAQFSENIYFYTFL